MQLSMIPVVLVLLMVRLGEAQGWLPVFARSFGDDLVVVPLVLWIIRFVHRQLRREQHWQLPSGHGLLAVMFFLLVFEGLLPGIMRRGTADFLDGIMYGVGFLYFHFILNQPTETGWSSCPPGINDEKENPALL